MVLIKFQPQFFLFFDHYKNSKSLVTALAIIKIHTSYQLFKF
jgi:hypothetical protein